jgi:hypothetical protein
VRRGLLLCLGLAACGPGRGPTRFDVEITSSEVYVLAHDADRPDPCDDRFILPGECGGFTDDVGCGFDFPDVWVESMRLERDGAILASGTPSDMFRTALYTEDLERLTLVIRADSGAEIRVDIPDAQRPAPVIDSAVDDGSRTTVTWHSDPPATSARAGHTDGSWCHALAPDPIDLPSESGDVGLIAYASPAPATTPVGDVHFWYPAVAATVFVSP